MNLATCYNFKGHTIYTDGRLYKAGELVGTYKTEAAAKAQATIRSRASNNARARAAAMLRSWRSKRAEGYTVLRLKSEFGTSYCVQFGALFATMLIRKHPEA